MGARRPPDLPVLRHPGDQPRLHAAAVPGLGPDGAGGYGGDGRRRCRSHLQDGQDRGVVMSPLGLVLFAATSMAGVALVVVGLNQAREPASDAADYLRDLDREDYDVTDFEQHLALPFMVRVVRPLGRSALDRVSGLLPRNHLDRVHHKLLMAGLSTTVRAEEFVTMQAVLLGVMSIAAITLGVFGNVSPRVGIFYLVVLPGLGILAPLAWLNRQVSERKTSIF